MAWVMSSQRVKAAPPRTDFFIGAVRVASIVMTGQPWRYTLVTFQQDEASPMFGTFGDALREMHRLLNSPPAEQTT